MYIVQLLFQISRLNFADVYCIKAVSSTLGMSFVSRFGMINFVEFSVGGGGGE